MDELVVFESSRDGWRVRFAKYDLGKTEWCDTIPHAVCEAVRAVVEEGKANADKP
jgi:hypothetical protein